MGFCILKTNKLALNNAAFFKLALNNTNPFSLHSLPSPIIQNPNSSLFFEINQKQAPNPFSLLSRKNPHSSFAVHLLTTVARKNHQRRVRPSFLLFVVRRSQSFTLCSSFVIDLRCLVVPFLLCWSNSALSRLVFSSLVVRSLIATSDL